MLRFALILAATIALGLLAVFSIFRKDTGPAYVPVDIRLAPQDDIRTSFEMMTETSRRITQEVTARFPGAPQKIIDIAAKIANGNIALGTYLAELESLSAEEINAGYGQAHDGFDYRHNLLREAVISGNTAAFAQMADQGADLSYNDNELPFQAVRISSPTGQRDVWFPDYRNGNRMLQAWIDAGGDPNITHPAYARGWGPVLMQTPINNLEGLDLLLRNGADPWARTQVRAADGIALYALPGFFETLVRADPVSLEVAFRLARNGHYADGPTEDKQRVQDAYLKLMEELPRDSSEASQSMIWLTKLSAGKIFEEDRTFLQDPRIQEFMRLQIGFNSGGLFLRETELRSPDSFDQYVDAAIQFGRHRWNR